MADERRPVVVYRERLANPSEPFIPAQGEGLERHVAHYLSIREPAGGALPAEAERLLPWPTGPSASARRYLWKRWGWSPAVVRRLKRLRPVLVHAHFGRDAVQLLPWVARSRVPLIVTFHGHDATRRDEVFREGSYSDRLFAERRAELAKVATRTIAVSRFIADSLEARGYPSDAVEVHYIGVDTKAIAAHAIGPRDPDLVVFVGRLVEQKGPTDLLAALAEVRATRPTVRAVIAGDGPLRTELERLAADLRLDVTFAGAIPPSDVWRLMGEAAVVVVPSRTNAEGWSEGFGLVAAEAQAAGAAVVASRNGGLPEAVAPAFHDHLSVEADPRSIAAQLCALLGDEPGRTARAADATRWVAEHRDLRRQTRRLEDIYESVGRP